MLRKVPEENLLSLISVLMEYTRVYTSEHFLLGLGSLLFETVKGVQGAFNSQMPRIVFAVSKLLDWDPHSSITPTQQQDGFKLFISFLTFLDLFFRKIVFKQFMCQMRFHVRSGENQAIWPVLEQEFARVASKWRSLSGTTEMVIKIYAYFK